MVVYRSYPNKPEVILRKTNKPSAPGPYKLGITASRRLIVCCEAEGKRKTVWMTPMPN